MDTVKCFIIGEENSGKELKFYGFNLLKDKTKGWNKEGFWKYFNRILREGCNETKFKNDFEEAVYDSIHMALSYSSMFQYISFGFLGLSFLLLLNGAAFIFPIILSLLFFLAKMMAFNYAKSQFLSYIDEFNMAMLDVYVRDRMQMDLPLSHFIWSRIKMCFYFK